MRPVSKTKRGPMTSQSGFSLVEVLVSMVVLTVGVLAVARSMAAMNHMQAVSTVLTRVAIEGASQMESLIAEGCRGVLVNGERVANGLGVRWVSRPDLRSVHLMVLVDYPLSSGNRVDSLVDRLPCPDEG